MGGNNFLSSSPLQLYNFTTAGAVKDTILLLKKSLKKLGENVFHPFKIYNEAATVNLLGGNINKKIVR